MRVDEKRGPLKVKPQIVVGFFQGEHRKPHVTPELWRINPSTPEKWPVRAIGSSFASRFMEHRVRLLDISHSHLPALKTSAPIHASSIQARDGAEAYQEV